VKEKGVYPDFMEPKLGRETDEPFRERSKGSYLKKIFGGRSIKTGFDRSGYVFYEF